MQQKLLVPGPGLDQNRLKRIRVMQLKEIREAFEGGTASANEINRQLIFSGIAIVWILKGSSETNVTALADKPLLLCGLILLALSLSVDLLQTLCHVGIWYCRYLFFKNKALAKPGNKDGLNEETITVAEKESWSIPTWILWGLKILITIAAYVLIIIHLFRQLS